MRAEALKEERERESKSHGKKYTVSFSGVRRGRVCGVPDTWILQLYCKGLAIGWFYGRKGTPVALLEYPGNMKTSVI